MRRPSSSSGKTVTCEAFGQWNYASLQCNICDPLTHLTGTSPGLRNHHTPNPLEVFDTRNRRLTPRILSLLRNGGARTHFVGGLCPYKPLECERYFKFMWAFLSPLFSGGFCAFLLKRHQAIFEIGDSDHRRRQLLEVLLPLARTKPAGAATPRLGASVSPGPRCIV